MKKLTALFLALILIFAFAACGADKDVPETASPAPTAGAPEETTGQDPAVTEVRGATVPAFNVTVNEAVVTNETMAAYPVYSVQATSVNSAGTESTVTYVGFAISDVLDAVGVTDYTVLTATADDGYAIDFAYDVASQPGTLLAVSKDGSQFTSSPWMAPCSSGTTGDYLKGCVAIKVDAEVTDTGAAAPDMSAAPAPDGAGLPEILDRTEKVVFGDYAFKINDKEVSNADLDGLKIYKITAKTINSEGIEAEAAYCGYKLADVLEHLGISGYSAVTAVANDGYESAYEDETANSDWTLLAIEKDGETGENGTVWVAPCAETSSKVFAKLVVELKAE